jgi:hypothetical protein
MPDMMESGVVVGILAAILTRFVPVRRNPPRPMPLWGTVLTGFVVAFAGPPVLDRLPEFWRAIPFLPEITEGMVFLAVFVAFFVYVVFRRKAPPRRAPLWVVAVISVGAAFAVPPLIYQLTGSYSMIALRNDVNRCTRGMQGEEQPNTVTNLCSFPIVVGLCASDEQNPKPCRQSVTLASGEVARLDPGDARLSFAPGNRDGLTVVACHPPNRPSRMLAQTGRRHRGVCLPAL